MLTFREFGVARVPGLVAERTNRVSLSAIRVVGLKLAAVCLLSVLFCLSSKSNYTVRTCGLSAAIAFASAAHAYVLFFERSGPCEDEVRVDALRTSEWSVTLVLTTILLHTIAEAAEPDNLNIISTQTAAVLQTLLVLSVACGRVLTKFKTTLVVLAVLLWLWTTIDVLLLVGWPFSKSGHLAQEAAAVVWAVSLIGLGYPAVKLLSPKPATKDVAHALLDGVCRGGLALYCSLSATN